MNNQVELIYDLNVGNQKSAPGSLLFIKAANIIFDRGAETASFIGLHLDGDITEASPITGQIRRRLIYGVQPSANLYFPTVDALKAATRNLFGRIFASQMPAAVTASEPVVT